MDHLISLAVFYGSVVLFVTIIVLAVNHYKN